MAIWAALTAPTYALPLDVVRVLVGAVSLAYFARTYREAPVFSGPNGLLDRGLQGRLLPFTRFNLFPARMPVRLLRGLYAGGCAAAILLSLGVAVNFAALFLYLLAVATYRWNFLVMYVDDAVMHLALFWMVVLPVGETLTLPELLSNPAGSWSAWQATTVPGLGVRCFAFNLALVYLVAGLWKWTSPMWRQGSALHAVLRMAVSYAPWLWQPALHPVLKWGNYGALILEPLFALLLVLPPHAPLKWALLGGAIAFHLGIVATMKFPFANLAMLGGVIVFFMPEFMDGLSAPALATTPQPVMPGDWLALGTVVCLALLFGLNARWFPSESMTMHWNAPPRRRPPRNPFYLPLWMIGLAQSYRLFDWIDERNYHVEYEVLERRPHLAPQRIDPTKLFPIGIRHVLLQSYLYGNVWIKLAPAALPELRASILDAYARRYCHANPGFAAVDVYATVQRLTTDNLDLHRGTRTHLLSFRNVNGEAHVTQMCLVPPAFS